MENRPDDRLKEEFLKMEIPDMKEDIMKNVKKENAPRERRRIRPAAVIVIAALFVVLAVTVGAAAGGMLKLNRGGKIRIMDENGVIYNPTGFHIEDEVDVPLSEKAIANIKPYVFLPLPGTQDTFFETADPAEMEGFLDMPLVLPQSIVREANLYRLWASGADGEAASISVQIGTPDDADVMTVYLRGSPGVIGTASEPVMENAMLPDGTPVSVAVAKRKSGGLIAHALYRVNDAVYHLRVYDNSKWALLNKVQEILDTVE